MRNIRGKLDYSTPPSEKEVLIFTANGFKTKGGKLVMGAGAAKAVLDAYPDIDTDFGKQMKAGKPYYLLFSKKHPRIGAFQVKDHFKDNADLKLIEKSTEMLIALAEENPEMAYHMNYPGIGNGGLDPNVVLPIIVKLPTNVLIYRE